MTTNWKKGLFLSFMFQRLETHPELKVTVQYNGDYHFALLLGMLCTLAFLPKNFIICFVALCPEIRSNFNVDTDVLLEYFVNTCIGRFLKTLHVVTLYFSSIFGICLIEPTRNYHEQIIVSKDGIRTFKDIFQPVVQTSRNLSTSWKKRRHM